MTEPSEDPNISLDPDPPVNGEPVLICLNGAHMPSKVSITVAGQAPVVIDVDKFCVYWTPPATANGSWINFHDENGECPDESRLCV